MKKHRLEMEGNVALSNRWTFFLWLTALNLYCFIRAWKKIDLFSCAKYSEPTHQSLYLELCLRICEKSSQEKEILHNLLWLFQFNSRQKHRRNQYVVHNSTSVPTKCSLSISLFSFLFVFFLFLFILFITITTTAMIFSSH